MIAQDVRPGMKVRSKHNAWTGVAVVVRPYFADLSAWVVLLPAGDVDATLRWGREYACYAYDFDVAFTTPFEEKVWEYIKKELQ